MREYSDSNSRNTDHVTTEGILFFFQNCLVVIYLVVSITECWKRFGTLCRIAVIFSFNDSKILLFMFHLQTNSCHWLLS